MTNDDKRKPRPFTEEERDWFALIGWRREFSARLGSVSADINTIKTRPGSQYDDALDVLRRTAKRLRELANEADDFVASFSGATDDD